VEAQQEARAHWWRDARPLDLLLPLAFGVIGTIEMLTQGFHPLPVSIGTYWLGALVLCGRRVFPLATPLVVALVYVVTPLLGFDVSESATWLLIPALAFFAVGLHLPRARAAAGFASVAGAAALLFLTLEGLTSFNPDMFFGLVWAFGPWTVGVSLSRALENNRELAARIERTRIEGEMATVAAAEAERRRIARELHDVLAHSLSVMVVQAMLAEDLLERSPAASRDAMHEVQQAGRNALGETSRLLRLIRDDSDELGMQPQHDINDLPELLNEFARAGMKVDLDIDPEVRGLAGGAGLSAYSIVREGLTNALKHAPGGEVTVRVARRTGDIAIEVRNTPGEGPSVTGISGGHGLVGVRERVALFGGSLDAGELDDGGFLLSATLPIATEGS
jgi:signal transduction histidine kinase